MLRGKALGREPGTGLPGGHTRRAPLPWAGESLEPGTRASCCGDEEGGDRRRGCSSQPSPARRGQDDLVPSASGGRGWRVLKGWAWRLRPFSEVLCLPSPHTSLAAPNSISLQASKHRNPPRAAHCPPFPIVMVTAELGLIRPRGPGTGAALSGGALSVLGSSQGPPYICVSGVPASHPAPPPRPR